MKSRLSASRSLDTFNVVRSDCTGEIGLFSQPPVGAAVGNEYVVVVTEDSLMSSCPVYLNLRVADKTLH